MHEILELLSIPYEYWIALLKAALFLTDSYALAIFCIAGIYLKDRHAFLQAFLVAVMGAFICQFVKSIYQIPLSAAVGHPGWSYPSGHTVFNLCFWLSVMWRIRSVLLGFLLFILFPLSAAGMVTMEYHTWDDILGGMYIAIPLVIAYIFLDKKTHETPLTVITLVGFSVALLCWVALIKYDFMYYLGFYFGVYITVLLLLFWENILKYDLHEAKWTRRNQIEVIFAISIAIALMYYPIEETFTAKFMQGFIVSLNVLFLVPLASKGLSFVIGKVRR